jgi:dihydroxyacetone kinase-like predicted kinase
MLIKRYSLEFILNSKDINKEEVKSSLQEFGENIDIVDDSGDSQKVLKISLETNDPPTIFDICAQFGRIGSIKVNEVE